MNLNRFSTLFLANGQKVKNRVVIPAMASETANHDGFATENTYNHYQGLAQAMAGILFVEYCYVHPSGRSEKNQLGIYNDKQISGLSKIAQIIKSQGTLAGIQLNHSGGKTHLEFSSGYLMTPSKISVPTKDQTLEIGNEMSQEEINLWKIHFIQSASRAVEAGFDVIEIHAAHGYGLNQWLSPITNLRKDEYGGNQIKRTKLLLEILIPIRKKYPTILLSVRIPGQDFLENGITLKDSQFIAKSCQEIGVDIINVSSGIGGWKRPKSRRGQGYLTVESKKIQSVINIPVIGVGGIKDGEFIDRGIKNKLFSLAAVGRAILNSPKEWGEQNLTIKGLELYESAKKNDGN